MQTEEVITTAQAAAKLGLSPGTLCNMRVRGEGPRFYKLGRMVRYRNADIDNWITAGMRHSTSEAAAA